MSRTLSRMRALLKNKHAAEHASPVLLASCSKRPLRCVPSMYALCLTCLTHPLSLSPGLPATTATTTTREESVSLVPLSIVHWTFLSFLSLTCGCRLYFFFFSRAAAIAAPTLLPPAVSRRFSLSAHYPRPYPRCSSAPRFYCDDCRKSGACGVWLHGSGAGRRRMRRCLR